MPRISDPEKQIKNRKSVSSALLLMGMSREQVPSGLLWAVVELSFFLKSKTLCAQTVNKQRLNSRTSKT